MADRILKILHRWATGNKKRKQRLIRVYLFIGRYIPALRARGDRIIIESKHADEQPEPVSGADDGVSAYDVPVPCEAPLVSVIVPNYNHAPYLRERLDSIYGQTYRHIEVILLDDASTDNSREILNAYREQHPENTKTVFNEVNSGRVNLQWNKGLELAKGQYIWIAESDDWCEPDFLEKLVPELQRQSVMIAFASSVFYSENEETNDLVNHFNNTEFELTTSFRMTAYSAVRKGFALDPFFPVISNCIFRNIKMPLQDILEMCKGLNYCSYLVFLLFLIKGGSISYVSDAVGHYRVYTDRRNICVLSDNELYIEENNVAKYVARNYQVEECTFNNLNRRLKNICSAYQIGESNRYDQNLDIPGIMAETTKRTPNIMICNFAMQSGGGEVFPIHLAMALRKKGVAITFVDVRMDEYNSEVRAMLAPSIPLVELSTPISLDCVCESFGGEIIHSHHAVVDKLIAQYVKKNRIKHVITLHGMYETLDKRNLSDILPAIYERCSCFAYIADKNLQPFIDRGMYSKGRFIKVNNGLMFDIPEPISREKLNISDQAFVFCLVSRAIYAKGWLEAVAAVKLANEKQNTKEIHLILVGEGEVYEAIKNNTLPYVHVVGMQKNPKKYFATADMGLLPSYFEGESVPLVVIESLMCGKPVLATDIGLINEMIITPEGEKAGCLVPLHHGKLDVKELSEKMLEVVLDDEKYENMKKHTKTAVERFDIMNVANEYLAIYRKVNAEG